MDIKEYLDLVKSLGGKGITLIALNEVDSNTIELYIPGTSKKYTLTLNATSQSGDAQVYDKAINGTSNQVEVSQSGNVITLSLPQDVDQNAIPTFSNIRLNQTGGLVLYFADGLIQGIESGTGNEVIGYTSTGQIPEVKTLSGTTNQVTITHGIKTITFSLPQDIHTSASPSFTGLTLSGLTASRLLASDGSKALASVANLASWVAGTTNRVSVTDDGDGTVTLSTPQDTHTGASPTFADVTIGGNSANTHITGTGSTVHGLGSISTLTGSSGVYTPTVSNTSNLDSSPTASQAQYCRVGSVVTVSGKVTVDPTATTTSTYFSLSLPIASNFAAEEDCAGTASAIGVAGQCAGIYADIANDVAIFQWMAIDVTSQNMFYSFTYRII